MSSAVLNARSSCLPSRQQVGSAPQLRSEQGRGRRKQRSGRARGPVSAKAGSRPFADLQASFQGALASVKLPGAPGNGAAPGSGTGSPSGSPAQSDQAQDGLEQLRATSLQGLKNVAKGFEDAVLPPKPPQPPQPAPQPTGSVTSGKAGHIQGTTAADLHGGQGRPAAQIAQHANSPVAETSAVPTDAAEQAQRGLSGGATSTAQSAAAARAQATEGLQSSADSLQRSAGDVQSSANSLQSSVQQAAAPSSGGSAPAGANDVVHNVQDAVSAAVASVQDAASGAVSSVQHSVSDSVSSFQETVSGVLSTGRGGAAGASDAVQNVVQSVNDTFSQAATTFNESSGGTLQRAQGAFQGVATSTQSALSGISGQVNQATTSAVNALPPEVREAAQAAQGPLKQLWSAILSDGTVATVAGAVVAVPLLLLWNARRGGFSGYLAPADALEVLNRRNAVLIDLRSLEQRQAEGIPELRFGARGKGAALDIPTPARSILSRVRNAGDLPFLVAAVEIQGLKQVSRGSQVVILETRRNVGKKLARALQSQGQARSYILEGGFRGWQAAGLPVKSAVEYESSALDAITDEVEVIGNNIRRTIDYVRDPLNVTLTGIVVVGAANTTRDWHNTLQVIGVYGPLVSTSLWLQAGGNPQEALTSLQQRLANVASGFGRLASGIGGLASGVGGLASKLIQLIPRPATAPSPAPAGSPRTSSPPPRSQATTPFSQALPGTSQPAKPDTAKSAPPQPAREAAQRPAQGQTAKPEGAKPAQDQAAKPAQAEAAKPAQPRAAQPKQPPPRDLSDATAKPIGQGPRSGEAAVKADTPTPPAQSNSAASATQPPAAKSASPQPEAGKGASAPQSKAPAQAKAAAPNPQQGGSASSSAAQSTRSSNGARAKGGDGPTGQGPSSQTQRKGR